MIHCSYVILLEKVNFDREFHLENDRGRRYQTNLIHNHFRDCFMLISYINVQFNKQRVITFS
jgi:hypothetical protein